VLARAAERLGSRLNNARGADRRQIRRVQELPVIEPEQGQPEYNPDFDGMIDPDYVEELVAAAVATLTG